MAAVQVEVATPVERVDLVPGLYAPRPDTLESTSPPELEVLRFLGS